VTNFKVSYTLAETGAPVVHVVEAVDRHHAAAIVYPAADESQAVEVEEVPDDFELERED
jgi:hypothetical protein